MVVFVGRVFAGSDEGDKFGCVDFALARLREANSEPFGKPEGAGP
jgi:hypothetical protein